MNRLTDTCGKKKGSAYTLRTRPFLERTVSRARGAINLIHPAGMFETLKTLIGFTGFHCSTTDESKTLCNY